MFPHSIRWRLNLWLGFMLFCVLAGFGFTIYQLEHLVQLNRIDEELERRVEMLSTALRFSPPGKPGGHGPFEKRPGWGGPEEMMPPNARPDERGGPGWGGPGRERGEGGFPPPMGRREFRLPPELENLFSNDTPSHHYFAVWSADGAVSKVSTNLPPGLTPPERTERLLRRVVRTRETYREVFRFNGPGDCVLAGCSLVPEIKAQRRFALLLLLAGGGVLAFAVGVSWWLTTRAIRPVEEISAAASRISAGHLAERITVAEPRNELGRLAGVLNSAFARLEAAFAQQRQFTADASHELRTPLAVIISETQSTLSRERTPAEYRETVETCLEAAQQMRRLSHSLLELARFDAGQEVLDRAETNLAELAAACVDLIRPLARERGLEIHTDLQPAQARVDGDQINRVLVNLLSNAIHYNRAGGTIRVTTRATSGEVILTVADTGLGINAEDLPNIFKRFYRADKSRARADGHSGLGLAIGQAILEAHGGRIEATSELGQGSCFTVRLPV